MRLLTKSRFKMGLECPNKLYFTQKSDYANQKFEDTFLQALAKGGFQVEELARMHFPEGVLVESDSWDYEELAFKTQELLQRENVVIYEAAFMYKGLFVRSDILVKKGNDIQLIEVKAKSYNASDENTFIGKRSGLVAGWKLYLFDVAFQKYVMQSVQPNWNIKSYFMLANKEASASVDGLNQMFRITQKANNRTGIERRVESLSEIGNSVLGQVEITEIIQDILDNKHTISDDFLFEEAVHTLRDANLKDHYLNFPTSYRACKSCEFKATDEDEAKGLKSGFKYCFQKQHFWKASDFKKPNIFDIWNFRRGADLFQEGKIFKEQLTLEDINYEEAAGKLSTSERQWIQITKSREEDESIWVDKEGLQQEMDSWTYPLHFIDFETSTVALPFNKGRRPYEQIAFQFSHHIYYEDASIEHASEYINNRAGEFPNFDFLRHLKLALEKQPGTIFRFAAHENTILNAIYEQLNNSDEVDKEELIEFIQHISKSTGKSAVQWEGERNMVDLCLMVKHFYYNPYTNGSNSIKKVLPAVLHSSEFLKQKYSQPISQIQLSSKNFDADHVWLKLEADHVVNPYDLLPEVFEGWTDEELGEVLSEVYDVADGGAALTAYAKLQYTDMSEAEREQLTKALLKYCELDTLAMIMIFEHFKEILE
ncbi:DUF2779 domain-containing protein [Weeksellaceae bacterium KMM 9724]|uniref:DUF2779 domain-containing protein n=1 Tax=Profundicola chukchiensis TaxID=2961959 RepID=UPI00243B99B8|nr:DUF2779 domain-containing protein [Profundicola chukchiensis]MDG4950715.1 DUF2779 domain-containing protein [Profundicola chukchiensis]